MCLPLRVFPSSLRAGSVLFHRFYKPFSSTRFFGQNTRLFRGESCKKFGTFDIRSAGPISREPATENGRANGKGLGRERSISDHRRCECCGPAGCHGNRPAAERKPHGPREMGSCPPAPPASVPAGSGSIPAFESQVLWTGLAARPHRPRRFWFEATCNCENPTESESGPNAKSFEPE